MKSLLLLLFAALCAGQLVSVDNILVHLKELDEIARIDGLNSRSVKNNYNASGAYIISQISQYCQPILQPFVVPVHTEVEKPTLSLKSPHQTAFQYGVDFQGMRYGGDGQKSFTAPVITLSGDGCSDQDWKQFPQGSIALIEEGSQCELYERVFLAENHNASAVFFSNQQTRTSLLNTRIRIVDWKGGDRLVQIPVLSISNLMGKTLSELDGPVVSLTVNMELTVDHTFNIICETNTGSKDDVIVAGAHLDSVPEGPGVNDNGSGSSSILEIALQFFRDGLNHKNAIRFIWWGAEEIGLLGARHYVRDLQQNDPEEYSKIALYLNFDMLGGPNYILYVHDADNVDPSIPEDVKDSSRIIQGLFEDHFKNEELPYDLTPMVAGSDFVPFIEGGIPSCGLATGAGSIKSAEERTKYGGLANAAYDPCYHIMCDSLENISREGLDYAANAAASVIKTLAATPNLRDFLKPKAN